MMVNQIEGVIFLPSFPRYFDNRGCFQEIFKKSTFDNKFPSFAQSNISISKQNVVRGLHCQRGNNAQGKLVQCIQGSIIDVIVDIVKESPTFMQVNSFELKNGEGMVYIPPHLAHGFWALEDNTIVLYHCTNEYNPGSEIGFNPLDRDLILPWSNIDSNNLIISPKDLSSPTVAKFCKL